MFKTMRRYIGASLLYLIYGSTIFFTCQACIGWVIARKEAEASLDNGLIQDIQEYGWGNHYIWQLIVVCTASYLGAYLAGAMAKKNGGVVASVSNIPHVCLRLYACFLLYTGKTIVDHKIAWGIIYPLSIIGSILFAYGGGAKGEQDQQENFDETTVLAIKPYHWFWIWLIGNLYILGFCSAFMRFLHFINISDVGIFSFIPFLLLWLPVLGYFFPVTLMYCILSGEMLKQKHVVIKISSFIGIYIGGLFLGGGVEWICIKILASIYKLFH